MRQKYGQIAARIRKRTLCLLVVLLASCRGGESERVDNVEAAPSASAPGPFSPRRPGHRYYLGRTQERCEVYWVDKDTISTPELVPCPMDLQTGERIRLSGKTCIRQSPTDPAREMPVVCPDPLTNLEKADRAAQDGGNGE